MIEKEKIQKVAANADLGKDYIVVDVEVKPVNTFTVFIESVSGITIGDCIKVSRFIEENFDREVEDYELSVSSAGIDKPLTHKIQYQKNVGKTAEVLLNDGKKLKGILSEVCDNSIKLTFSQKEKSAETKKTTLVEKELEIEFNNIKSVMIVVSFK